LLDLRLYRAGLLPFLVVLAIVAFSVEPLPGPLTSSIPAPAFDGPRAFNTLEHLEARFPSRAPGSGADRALGALIARRLAGDGYHVDRAGANVIATQPGSGRGYLVLLANRSGAGAGALSGTAALLELAHDLGSRGGLRPLALVSSDTDAAPALPRPVAAAIVLGDLAGTASRHPFEIPFSNAGSVAALSLQQTLDAALPGDAGRPALLDQLAELAVPFSPSPQAPLLDAGIPAVLAQQSGEPGPAPSEPVSEQRLAAFGRAIAVVAADLQQTAPLTATTRDLTLAGDRLGGWAVRALVGALLLAVALPVLDVFARARRRKLALARPLAWLLLWGAPVAGTLFFTKLLAKLGVLGAVPGSPTILAPGARGITILAATVAFFALACLARAAPARRQRATGAPVVLVCVATVLALVLWIANPYTAALLVLPLYLWLPLLLADADHAPRPLSAIAWLLISLVPLGGLLAVEAVALDAGPLRFAWSWLLLLASGQLGALGLLALSLAGALLIGATILLLDPAGPTAAAAIEVRTRGPINYAGPGSLGGTASGRSAGR
jgi:hypothetical protein